MTRFRKVALVILSLILLSQIPFVYRRFKLRWLQATIQQLNATRTPPASHSEFSEYKGVIHVHSALGGHSQGTFAEIISAAQTNQLQFVVMTEHTEKDFDTASMTLAGLHGGVLFVNGNEVSQANDDRMLVIPGMGPDANNVSSPEAVPHLERAPLRLAAYPNEFKDWDSAFDGVEIYNLFTNSKQINPIVTFFDALWSIRSYPDLIFTTFYKRPDQALKKWDEALRKRKLVGIAGNDAHSNVGLSLNDSSGKTLIGIKLDPYVTSFHLVRMHVLIPRDQPFETGSLVEALKKGHAFIAFDLLGDATGFNFTAETDTAVAVQGDEITHDRVGRLRVVAPLACRVVLFKDGQVIQEVAGVTNQTFEVAGTGVYRVELYLPQLGKGVGEQPWIISNPLYVR